MSVYLVLAGHLESGVEVFDLVLEGVLLLLEPDGDMGGSVIVIVFFTPTLNFTLSKSKDDIKICFCKSSLYFIISILIYICVKIVIFMIFFKLR